MRLLRHAATIVLLLLAAGPAVATVRIENRAMELGYPAGNCDYCHTFDLTHMKKGKNQDRGKVDLDCNHCHPGGLPKTGAALFTDRGKWLLAQKKARHASSVDADWLKDYVEPKKRPKP
jgi:hypothetical protein